MIKRSQLDELYKFYNSRKWIHPDPLEFLYNFKELRDQEIAGLIASSLAYGRVSQILKSVSSVLDKMGSSPFEYLKQTTQKSLQSAFMQFKHRFTNGENLISMLLGIKYVIEEYGSLYECFQAGMKDEDTTILPALSFFVQELRLAADECPGCLLSLPAKGSACKKLNLFLRWMVRKDNVDPGGWQKISPSKLIIPLDTHMHRICTKLGLTDRKSGDMRTALEITQAFQEIEPEDPVKYDFALTRLGIRKDMEINIPKLYLVTVSALNVQKLCILI